MRCLNLKPKWNKSKVNFETIMPSLWSLIKNHCGSTTLFIWKIIVYENFMTNFFLDVSGIIDKSNNLIVGFSIFLRPKALHSHDAQRKYTTTFNKFVLTVKWNEFWRLIIFLIKFYYTSVRGQYYVIRANYVIFSDWVETFFQGFSDHLSNEMTINLYVCDSVILLFCDYVTVLCV